MNNFGQNLQQNMQGGAPAGAPMGQPAGQPAGQKPDMVDKAFDFVAKKSGHPMNPQTEEKITDEGRTIFEKMTG